MSCAGWDSFSPSTIFYFYFVLYLYIFLRTLFQFGLTIAPVQNTDLINAKVLYLKCLRGPGFFSAHFFKILAKKKQKKIVLYD